MAFIAVICYGICVPTQWAWKRGNICHSRLDRESSFCLNREKKRKTTKAKTLDSESIPDQVRHMVQDDKPAVCWGYRLLREHEICQNAKQLLRSNSKKHSQQIKRIKASPLYQGVWECRIYLFVGAGLKPAPTYSHVYTQHSEGCYSSLPQYFVQIPIPKQSERGRRKAEARQEITKRVTIAKKCEAIINLLKFSLRNK